MSATDIAATMPVSAILIGPRHRADMGDLRSLAKSIAEVGLLHPIVVDRSGRLIAGERRLRTCAEILGWSEVPVRVVDLVEIVRGELAENAERKDFLPREVDAIRRALEPVVATPEGRPKTRETFPSSDEPERGRTRDKIGAFAGISGRTVEKIAKVVEAAEAEPERFGRLVHEMDRTGKVNSAFRQLRRAEDEDRIKGLTIAPGKCRALVVDLSLDYESLSLAGRSMPEYAVMTHEQMLALAPQIEALAEDDAHMYMWVTNAFIMRGGALMAAYGFQHKSVLTWAKPSIGMGAYFRGQTEHVLFGIRGNLPVRSDSISTLFHAPRTGVHSENPEAFYDIVRAASYPPFGEVFQRKARPDFKNVYVAAPSEATP